MAELAIQEVDHTGLEPDAGLTGAAAGGDTWQNTGQEMLRVVNGSGAPITVTVDSVQACDQGFDHDVQVAVPAGEERWLGPFETARFGRQPSLSYSAVTSLQVGVYQVG